MPPPIKTTYYQRIHNLGIFYKTLLESMSQLVNTSDRPDGDILTPL